MANTTPGSAGLEKNYERYLDVFSKKMKYVLCDIAVKNGYSKEIMDEIFINEIHYYMALRILVSKLDKRVSIKKVFWRSVYPSVKQYPIAWRTIIPAYFIPGGIVRLYNSHIKYVIKPIRKVVKEWKKRK